MQLVISDSHRGLTNAVTTVLQGAAWQRCRVQSAQRAGLRLPALVLVLGLVVTIGLCTQGGDSVLP